MKGVFSLASPRDLLAKLRYDLDSLRPEPNNPYIAFNFFVTAEHMLDWVYPGYARKAQREQLMNREILLQTVSHIASGAKHFVAEAKHHVSITGSARRPPHFGRQYFGRFFGNWFFRPGPLMISLTGPAAAVLGSSIPPLALAEKVFAFWEAHPDLQ